MTRIPSHGLAVAALAAVALSCSGQVRPEAASAELPSGNHSLVFLETTGIPRGATPNVYVVRAEPGGGYRPVASLGPLSALPYDLPSDAIVEVAPIYLSRTERLMSVNRFQAVSSATAKRLVFDFEREFELVVAKWSWGDGPGDANTVQGDVWPESQWVHEHTIVELIATAHPGWRFAHWAIFQVDEPLVKTRVSSVTPRTRLRVEASTKVVATFVPR